MKINEIIEGEEGDIEIKAGKLEDLKKKWFKTSSSKDLEKFLIFYLEEKRKLVKQLRGFKKKK